MAREVSTMVGSGTIPYTRGILPAAQFGAQSTGEGIRTGTQVVLANPEDLTSASVFATSGVTVGTTPVEILGPNTNPLPRMREVIIQNLGAADVYIKNDNDQVALEGLELTVPGANDLNTIRLPVLHNTSIWAATAAGTANIRMLILL